ncbi:MAG: hypothetical protein GY711_15590 [bacterium]|nr:hypothetical protein [bacterium]
MRARHDGPADAYGGVFRNALGRDHMWITAAERKQLTRGELPADLADRIARFHCIDNTRGRFVLRKDDERSFVAALYGHVTVEDGDVSALDFVVRGDYAGAGRWTSNEVPAGTFQLAIAGSLASRDDPARAVPPQGLKSGVYWR